MEVFFWFIHYSTFWHFFVPLQVENQPFFNVILLVTVTFDVSTKKTFVCFPMYTDQSCSINHFKRMNESRYLTKSRGRVNNGTNINLQIWKEASMPGGLKSWLLNPTFRSNLKMALTGRH